MRIFARYGLLLIVVMFIALSPLALRAAPPPQTPTLQVATRIIEPFVIQEPAGLRGFSIELWEEISRRSGLEFEYIVVGSIDELLNSVRRGEADLAIAAISMTPQREAGLDFSYPIFNSGLQIMIRLGGHNWFGVIGTLLSEIWGLILGLVIVMAVVAHVIWWFERRRNPDFAQTYWPGVWDAFWWAGVTLSTVGYGDKAPRTNRGRVLALLWIFSGLFLVANFTAAVASELTLSELRGSIGSLNDLQGRDVLTVRDSTAEQFLRDRAIQHRSVEDIAPAIAALNEGQADAIVYDAPVLNYYAATTANNRVRIVGDLLQTEPYGIAMPEGSPLREQINRTLLEVISDGTYDRLYRRYFDGSR